jgi:hypothetical protein
MAESVWRSLGSIVGIGVGSIELMLVKHAFRPGETVHGRLLLKLEEPVEAKRLVIGVHATEERERWTTDARGQKVRERETRTRYRVERQLEGKRSFRGDAWDFHLPLPGPKPSAGPDFRWSPGATELPAPEGFLGDVVRLVAAVARPQLDWRVYAFLDIPWKTNLKAGADITVE